MAFWVCLGAEDLVEGILRRELHLKGILLWCFLWPFRLNPERRGGDK